MIFHDKTAFKDMKYHEILQWVELNKTKLVGSAVFARNQSITSKIVQWAERWHDKKEVFTPSHVGSVIKYNGEIYLFDMKPMKAKVTLLADYIYGTQDEYVIAMRDFSLNSKIFSASISEHIGEFYPFMSAIRSVFSKRQTKWRQHCSELHARTLQLCGYEFPPNFNLECTPDELLKYFKKN